MEAHSWNAQIGPLIHSWCHLPYRDEVLNGARKRHRSVLARGDRNEHILEDAQQHPYELVCCINLNRTSLTLNIRACIIIWVLALQWIETKSIQHDRVLKSITNVV